MNKVLKVLLVVVLASLLLAAFGCAEETPAPAPAPATPTKAITDHLNRVVTIKGIPQKIISLAPSNTEILFALGLGERVVGVTDFDDYPPEARQKQSIGGYSTPNIEQIMALEPDLVLAVEIHENDILPQLEARGLTVVALSPRTVAQILDSITLVGKITGKEKEAADLTASLQKRINAVTDLTTGLAEAARPHVFYVVWHDPLMTAGNGTPQDELISLAGGRNIAANMESYPTISLETVLAADPEVIITGESMGIEGQQIFQAMMDEDRLAPASARQAGKVYAVDGNLVSRPGPRIVDGLEEFLKMIHPELQK